MENQLEYKVRALEDAFSLLVDQVKKDRESFEKGKAEFSKIENILNKLETSSVVKNKQLELRILEIEKKIMILQNRVYSK